MRDQAEKVVVSFTKVKLPNGWLGSMSAHPVVLDDVRWFTAEHAFQANRLPLGHQMRGVLQMMKSPMTAKMLIKPYRGDFLHEPGSDADLDLMRRVLRAKLATNPQLWPLLEQTGTAVIVEDVTARNHGSGPFWGAALIDGQWIGENWLGRLWMEIRDGHGPSSSLNQ